MALLHLEDVVLAEVLEEGAAARVVRARAQRERQREDAIVDVDLHR